MATSGRQRRGARHVGPPRPPTMEELWNHPACNHPIWGKIRKWMMGLLGSKACAERLNTYSAVWFWLTVVSVFYFGLTVVLPALYDDLFIHHIIIAILFSEMIINFIFIRVRVSPFDPSQNAVPQGAEADALLTSGYEINLDHLKNDAEGGFNISPTNVKPTSIPRKYLETSGYGQTNSVTSSLPVPTAPINSGGGKNLYLMALPQPEDETRDHSKKIVFPYWSWKPCLTCQVVRPPRTHHCPLCHMCVLKRDHHCFFVGSCIGLHNQRHFVVFNFWASLALLYCLVHSLWYLVSILVPNNSWCDVVLPLTVVRWLLSYVSGVDALMITVLYSVVWFFGTSLGFLVEQIRLIYHGTTSFEEDNKIKITNSNSMSDNIRGVFGEHWMWNFILPLHQVYQECDDGVNWHNVKV